MLRLAPTTAALLAGFALMFQFQPVAAATDELPANSQVAVIGVEPITLDQMAPGVQAELAENERRYEQQLHQLALDHRRDQRALIENRAGNFLDGKLLQNEAQSLHISVQELIKTVKSPEVTDADIRSFYEQHKQQIKQPFETAIMPITEHLMHQAAEDGKRDYLAGLRAKYSARVTVEPLREDVSADGPIRGPADARVTIVEFSDFQCPFCGQMAPVLRQVLNSYPHDVRLVYRQMPLSNLHPNAMRAAQASVCAQQQGKFWEMHDALFADQNALDADGLKHTAEHLRLRTKPFVDCLESKVTATAIAADVQAGVDYGVNGTPGLFVNGRFFSGALPYERIAAVIDEELARQPQTPLRVGRTD